MDLKFCTSCGAELVPGASFCRNCGKQLSRPAQPSAPAGGGQSAAGPVPQATAPIPGPTQSGPATAGPGGPLVPPAPAPAAPPPASGPPEGGSQKKAAKWLIPVAIGLVVGLGGAGAYLFTQGGSSDAQPAEESESPAEETGTPEPSPSGSSAAPTPTATPTPTPTSPADMTPEQAGQELASMRARGQADLEAAVAAGLYVPQVSSACAGLVSQYASPWPGDVAVGETFTNNNILQRHLFLEEQYGAVTVQVGDYTTDDSALCADTPTWQAWIPIGFATQEAVAQYCSSIGIDSGNCAANRKER